MRAIVKTELADTLYDIVCHLKRLIHGPQFYKSYSMQNLHEYLLNL